MANPIRPEDLPPVPDLGAGDAFIVDTGVGVYKATPVEIVEAGDGVTAMALAAEGAEISGYEPISGGPVFSIGRKLRERMSVFDVASNTQVSEIINGTSTDDTDLFNEAFANAIHVEAPNGTFRVEGITVPTDKTLIGFGKKTVLKLVSGASTVIRPIIQNGETNIEIANLTIDGDGASLDLALLTDCVDVSIHHLWLTGSDAYGLTLDGCGGCDVDQLRVFDSGTTSSHAGVYLKNPTANGSFNRVSRAFFRDIEGRGIFCLGHNQAQINAIRGLMTNGEILLLEDCYGAVATNITWAGPGAASSSLSDGIAINGNCVENTISGFYGVFSSGHGVSINGQWEADGITPKTGASRNVIGPGVIISPNEGGVIVTDQAVPGSIPAENIITGVVVRDAGRKVASEAFGVTGGVDNQFLGVLSRGTAGGGGTGTSRGFHELAGGSGNVPERNSFKGIILGTYNSGRVSYSSASSAVVRADTERSLTRITFDGTTGTVIGTSTNGATVVKNGTGDYTINTVFPNATDIGVVGIAQETAGVPNNVTLTSVPSTTSVRIKVVAAGTATATDSARVYVELR